MTEKEKLFCLEYLKDLNGTRAYMAVYRNCKSERAAAACAARLLRKANIKSYIEEQLASIKSQKMADAQEVMEYLTAVMRGESKAEIVVLEGDGNGCSSARRIDKAPDEKERLKAAELLGKSHMLFTDKVSVDSTEKVVIIDDLAAENK